MAPSSRDRLSVDLHGLKAALLDRAKALGVTPSNLVRSTLADALGATLTVDKGALPTSPCSDRHDRARLCLRMSRAQAEATLGAARSAGLTPGQFVGDLVLGVPVLASGGSRTDLVATLVASSAELSTLSRNLHRLTTLLRQADSDAARQYRQMLDTLAADVRNHLNLAASALADLQPQRRRGEAPRSLRHLTSRSTP